MRKPDDSIRTLRMVDIRYECEPNGRQHFTFRFDGPGNALSQLQELKDEKLESFYLFHAIKGELLSELNESKGARDACLKASMLADNQLEQEYLAEKAELN